MDRRMMLENVKGGGDMTEWKLIDTITITPSERKKRFDFSQYKEKEFWMLGIIPKTKENTYFYVGVGEMNAIKTNSPTNGDPYELSAYLTKIENSLYGFCGLSSGFSSVINGLMKSPRVSVPTETIMMQFYPFVAGDEQAIVQIYAR